MLIVNCYMLNICFLKNGTFSSYGIRAECYIYTYIAIVNYNYVNW